LTVAPATSTLRAKWHANGWLEALEPRVASAHDWERLLA
jgi:hypothetical protein